MSRWAKLLVACLSSASALLAAEVWVRTMDLRKTPLVQEGPQPTQPSADPRIRYELRPGATQVTRYLDVSGAIQREVLLVINAQGFRGPEVELAKPSGTIRIIAVGDSQTYGSGVQEGEAWPAVLERALSGRTPGARVEVMNGAVPGYDSEQEAAAIETRWLDYQPDLVLLGFFVNDTSMPDLEPDPGYGRSSALLRFLFPGRPGVLSWLRRRSQLVDHLTDRLFHKAMRLEMERLATVLFQDEYDGFVRARAAIERARNLAEARGSRFAVILLPFLLRSEDGLISTGPYRKVAEFCRSRGIPCLDLEPTFQGLDVERLCVHPRDRHSGPEAHRLEGEAIERWIGEAGLLPVSSGR